MFSDWAQVGEMSPKVNETMRIDFCVYILIPSHQLSNPQDSLQPTSKEPARGLSCT